MLNRVGEQFRATCFVVSTPYQLIGAIALARAIERKADLYWLIRFNGYEKLLDRLKRIKIFRKIYIVDKKTEMFLMPKNLILYYWRMGYAYLFIERYIRRFMRSCDVYDDIYFGYYDPIVRIITAYCLKVWPKTKIHHFEDGEGSYDTDSAHSIVGRKEKIVRHILCGKESINYELKWHLFSPELYRIMHPNMTKLIDKIPNIWKDSEMQRMIVDIFGVNESNKLYDNIVLLDVVHNEVLTDTGENELDQIYKKIFAAFGYDNILVKKHPRDKKENYPGCKYGGADVAPFEVLCIGANMNEKLLISVASTALATPKIMTDQEPYVLLLYKLIDGWKNDGRNKDAYYGAIKKLYRNSEKFMIPETMEEFDKCLQVLKKIFGKKVELSV